MSEGRDRERHAHEEDPAPVEVDRQPAADQRPRDARQAPDRAEESLDAGSLFQGEHVSQQGQDDRGHGPGTQALNGPHGDQLAHALRGSGEHRAHAEQDQAEQQDPLAAEEVGELAVNRRADGRCQQVGRDDPGIDLEALELGDDRGHGRRDDQLLHRRHHHRHQERSGHLPPARDPRPGRGSLLPAGLSVSVSVFAGSCHACNSMTRSPPFPRACLIVPASPTPTRNGPIGIAEIHGSM